MYHSREFVNSSLLAIRFIHQPRHPLNEFRVEGWTPPWFADRRHWVTIVKPHRLKCGAIRLAFKCN